MIKYYDCGVFPCLIRDTIVKRMPSGKRITCADCIQYKKQFDEYGYYKGDV